MMTTLGWRRGAALASPLLLALVLSCAAKVRNYPNGSGGGSSSSASSTGSSTASSTGTGGTSTSSSTGTGTGGGSPTCTGVGVPFDVLSTADIPGVQLDDKPLLIVDPSGSHAMVHVLIRPTNSNGFIVRSIVDNNNSPVQNLLLDIPNMDSGVPPDQFTPAAGLAANGSLILYGFGGNPGIPSGVGSLTFQVTPDQGVVPGGGFALFNGQPQQCQGFGNMNRLSFAEPQSGQEARWVGVCTTQGPDAGQTAYFYAGGEMSGATLVATGNPNDPIMQPDIYAVVNGTHLLFLQNNNNPPYYVFGADPSMFGAMPIPFAFSNDSTVLQGIFGALNTTANDGVTLLGGYIDMVNTAGQFYAGTVTPGDFGKLAQVPPAGLNPIGKITSLSQLGPLFRPLRDPASKTIVIAGASLTGQAVNFTWLKEDGSPLLVQKQIYTPDPMSKITITAAAAAPFGQFNKLVVWVQKDPTGAYSVQGQQFLCDMTGG